MVAPEVAARIARLEWALVTAGSQIRMQEDGWDGPTPGWIQEVLAETLATPTAAGAKGGSDAI